MTLLKCKRTPKHAKIEAHVRRMIRTGRLAVGKAIPTELELARRFKCSRGTVRRGLDTLVNDGLIRRKQGAGHFVTRRLPAGRETVFGLIVPNILNAELLRLAQLFTLEAGAKGYQIVLGVTSNNPAIERGFICELHRLKASGVIKFPTLPSTPEFEPEIRTRMRTLGMPYVIINDFWTDTRHDHHVAFDEAAAVEMAVDHLLRLGHKRIGWVDDSSGLRTSALARLRKLLSRHDLDLPEARVLTCPPYERPPVEKLWGDGLEGPTAIMTPYDGMAIRLIEALPRIGFEVPRDVSVVNLNGPSFYTTSGLELTTALPPDDKIVAKALEILTGDAHEEAICQYLFRPRFHVGRTTAEP